MNRTEAALSKRRTGIPGLDEAARGGLPAAGSTLVAGEAGAGKTVLCLQILAYSQQAGEQVVFLSFEESKAQIQRNALSFDWGRMLLDSPRCHLVDARPQPEVGASGDFDLDGIKALIEGYAAGKAVSWVALDGIDRLLRMHPDNSRPIEMIIDLDNWSRSRGLSLLLTSKVMNRGPEFLEGLEFMLDTVIGLSADLVGSRLNRRFRILKYRGSGHITDGLPLVMDDQGLHIPYGDHHPRSSVEAVSSERCSTGIEALDRVLDGGIYRGSATLISGQPGTAKTSLAASIAAAAAARGERVLYLSFDELADRIIRNVASVGIDLGSPVQDGRLHLYSREAWRSLVEEHYITITRWLDELAPRWLIIDPVSALMKATSAEDSHGASERLLSVTRARGITTVLTSLSEGEGAEAEATLSHTSTLADTWISLGYAIRAGERNRSLSVIKSRGTAHSNQVRELLLSRSGIDLARVYQFGSEVLMGTARMQKESEETSAAREREQSRERRERELRREIEQARQRLGQAESEMKRLEERLQEERQAASDTDLEQSRHHEDVRRRREPLPREGEKKGRAHEQ